MKVAPKLHQQITMHNVKIHCHTPLMDAATKWTDRFYSFTIKGQQTIS